MSILEVGGGETPKYHPNMDSRSLPTVDIIQDIVKPWPFKTDSLTLVYMSHCLEHVYYDDVPTVLSEAYRVLSRGGKLELKVPDLHRNILLYSSTYEWTWRFIMQVIYGEPKKYPPWSSHCCGFWPIALLHLLRNAGFHKVKVTETFYGMYPDLTAEAFK